MAEIKVEKTIYELLQEVRYELVKANLKKTGKGNTGKREYSYFDLPDFLPKVTELFYERGLCPVISIGYDSNGIEMGTLKIIKGTEMIPFSLPTAECMTSSNPIQNLGSKATYMRRYLYMNALDLSENDTVELSDNENVKTNTTARATAKQISLIKELYDVENIAKMLQWYNIEKLEDISMKDASAVIAKKAKK